MTVLESLFVTASVRDRERFVRAVVDPVGGTLTAEQAEQVAAALRAMIGEQCSSWTDHQRRTVFAMLRDAGIPDGDRHEFAANILGRDVTTFQTLTAREADRLIDALRGHAIVAAYHLSVGAAA